MVDLRPLNNLDEVIMISALGNKYPKNVIFGFLVFSLIPFSVKAQDAEIYSWFDNTIGLAHTELYNGVGYLEAHRTINEHHKFFLTNQFVEGTLYYNGQPYFSPLLKYNVFDEILLVQVRNGENESLFQLIKEKIDGFEIQGHFFINIKPGENSNVAGFFEVLEESDQVQLLKKHARTIHQIIERRTVYYEFKPKSMGYILKLNNEYYQFDSRKDVLRIFPEARKEVKQHFATEKNTKKYNPDKFFVDLVRKVSTVIYKNNNGE